MKSGSTERLRIIVLGYIVRGPMGGMAWHYLQYVLGLHDLGHDVYFVEDSDDTEWCCYDPLKGTTGPDPTYGLEFARQAFERLGLGSRWAYYDSNDSRWFGPCAANIVEICTKADLVLNVSCANPVRPWLAAIPARALIDTDPVFTQIRNLTDPVRRDRALQHNAFFSFAGNIRSPHAAVPDDGIPWQATNQPVVLRAWPVTTGPAVGRYSTVMQWDSYAKREHGGLVYGMKSQSFLPFLDLPKRTGCPLELALGAPASTAASLRENGWLIRDSIGVTGDPWSYQRYLQESKAEFSVAKHGYAVSRSGWFSERSAAYLASGRPVLTQDTGFSDWMETGAGVLSFGSPDEALAGLARIESEYPHHCRRARELAEDYFDSAKVLTSLIERAMQSLPAVCGKNPDV